MHCMHVCMLDYLVRIGDHQWACTNPHIKPRPSAGHLIETEPSATTSVYTREQHGPICPELERVGP